MAGDIRERLAAHRQDVLILLQEVSSTARLHEGILLAGAIRHIAKVQALLAEELVGLLARSESEPASPADSRSPSSESLDDTPVEGMRDE